MSAITRGPVFSATIFLDENENFAFKKKLSHPQTHEEFQLDMYFSRIRSIKKGYAFPLLPKVDLSVVPSCTSQVCLRTFAASN